jgi:hypothetical protein
MDRANAGLFMSVSTSVMAISGERARRRTVVKAWSASGSKKTPPSALRTEKPRRGMTHLTLDLSR